MEKVFNKLVRDKIPKIITMSGEVSFTRILDDYEYKNELFNKLKEECNEVCEAKSSNELLEELADVMEVVRALAKLENSSIEMVNQIADNKREKCGEFANKIFLEKTINDG